MNRMPCSEPFCWKNSAIEAALLGLFMLSAASFGVLLEHPSSTFRQAIDDPFARRALMGLAMGLTAIGLIQSPWGKRSGAQMNPAATLSLLSIGRMCRSAALAYVVSQVAGAVIGMGLAVWIWRDALAVESVNYVATLPGMGGELIAFSAELAIAALLIFVALAVARTPRSEPYTGLAVGTLVALYITFEAPLSGMSLNPARSFGSALWAGEWRGFWIYLTAPPLGMLLGAQLHQAVTGRLRQPMGVTR